METSCRKELPSRVPAQHLSCPVQHSFASSVILSVFNPFFFISPQQVLLKMHSKKQAPVKYYVGIDVGSASVRAALVDEFGTVVAHADQPIQIWEPQPDHYEQSSAGIWAACCSVTKVCKKRENKGDRCCR